VASLPAHPPRPGGPRAGLGGEPRPARLDLAGRPRFAVIVA